MTTLITGFPGFIAGRLVRRLLQEQDAPAFSFLVQDEFVDIAKSVLKELESDHPKLAGSWKLVRGDLRQKNLGLTEDALEEARSSVTRVWHLAAIYDLAVPQALAYDVNVEGTLNVLELCASLKKLEALFYISTCYVAGDRKGRVYEDELDKGQGFKNHYESTKFWAEKHVQRWMDRIPTVIFRPSIVVGDSRTGETIKGDGPYFFMKLLLRTPRWVPMVNIGPSTATANFVPVDFLVEAMARISQNPEAIGKVFQLADPNPFSSREVLSMMVKHTHRVPVVGTIPLRVADVIFEVPPLQKRMGIPEESVAYFNHPVEFDVSNTRAFLEPQDIRCPSFDAYLPVLLDYARQHPEIFRRKRK